MSTKQNTTQLYRKIVIVYCWTIKEGHKTVCKVCMCIHTHRNIVFSMWQGKKNGRICQESLKLWKWCGSIYFLIEVSVSSVTQLCPTLCDSMDCSTPGLCPSPNPGVCLNSCPLCEWCHPTISSSVIPFSSCLQSFPASDSYPESLFSASGGQNIGVSASASVLPMNIQDWFPLGLTGWISLQSKRLSRVISNAKVQKHQFFMAQLSFYSPTLTSIEDYLKKT